MTDILILGEAWGKDEAAAGEAFVGASGKMLNGLLAMAGIDRRQCYVTNVFNLQPRPTNDVSNLCGPKPQGLPGYPPHGNGKYVRAEFKPEVDRLYREINSVQPKLIIALGNTALWALRTQKPSISRERGALCVSNRPEIPETKVLPTYHPAAILRDFALRPIVISDLAKAKRHSTSREFTRPQRALWIEPTLDDIRRWIELHFDPSRPLGIDIETKQGTITEVGFAYPDVGLVIPFFSRGERDGNYWRSFEDEAAAWAYVAELCGECRRPIFQNGLYDINYLWRTMGIQVRWANDDTMLLHHALQPEMKKGLGFLGSVYTDEPAWKFLRKDNERLKRGDEE
jgi:uracil-DNA glycosylase